MKPPKATNKNDFWEPPKKGGAPAPVNPSKPLMMGGGALKTPTLQANNNFTNKPQPVPVKPTQLASNLIKDTPGKDSDDYEDDAAYDEDFDEDEEETFKKTAADFAKQLNQLKTVNDKRKEIVEKMERDVVKTTN